MKPFGLFGPRALLFIDDPAPGGSGDPKVDPPIAPVIDEKFVREMISKEINATAKRLEGDATKKHAETSGRFDKLSEQLAAVLKPAPIAPGEGEKPLEMSPAVKAVFDAEKKEREKLEKRIAESEDGKRVSDERADKVQRDADVRGAMAAFQFANKTASDTVFDVLSSKVKRDADGGLIVSTASGDTTLEAYLKDYTEKVPGILAAVQLGGSGAGPNGTRKGTPEIDSINSYSTKDQKNAYLAEIQRVAKNTQR